MTNPTLTIEQARPRLRKLGLHGLAAQVESVLNEPWLSRVLEIEETERGHRSLKRRLRNAQIGAFKPLADFDWAWPTQCDRGVVEELMTLAFLEDASNIVLVGPNGVGKTMCACNLGYQAVLSGRTALFTTAAQLLGELTSLDSDSALRRRLKHYAAPDLLMIDEVGYLSYSNRHADLLFPNAACVVSLIDRLMHRAEVVRIEGKSYRQKEAEEREVARKSERAARKAASRSRKAAP